MNVVHHENFRATGYRESVTEVLGVGVTVDEDALASDVGSPAKWGQQCLKIVTANAEDSYAYPPFFTGNETIYFRGEFDVDAESLADAEVTGIYDFLHDPGGTNDRIAVCRLYESGGSYFFLFDIWHDGTQNSYNEAINIGQTYTFEMKWDLSDDTWAWWFDGVAQESGSITGTPSTTPWHLEYFHWGTFAPITQNSATIYFGPTTVSDDGRIRDALYPAETLRRGFRKIDGGLVRC